MKATVLAPTQAVVEWTGWAATPWPARDDARLIARFGREAGPALAKAARRLEAERTGRARPSSGCGIPSSAATRPTPSRAEPRTIAGSRRLAIS